MSVAPVFVPSPVYGHSIELALIERLRDNGEALVNAYIAAHTTKSVCFVSRDAAKTMFPEFLENKIANNRYADGAASALADAPRRTILGKPPKQSEDRIVILTGAPASGKTGSVGPRLIPNVGIQHETILTSLARACELIEQSLGAGRFPILRLFYTDDPRINVRRMIKRALKIGRTVPLGYMAKTYVSVPELAGALKIEFGDKLDVRVTNNSETPSEAVHHNSIERALYHVNRYTESSALEAMSAQLDEISSGPDGIPEIILREALRKDS